MSTALDKGIGNPAQDGDPAPGLTPLSVIRDRYEALYRAAAGPGAAWPGKDGSLPPYLCRLLNQGAPLGAAAEGPQAVLGTDADPLVSVGSGRLRLRYADSVAPHLYDT
ncbi:hypothetical protein P8605_43040, partial [Streptomyces sp. T-3]|nr:hypothetical protein [Streptomyces sp. T-3]